MSKSIIMLLVVVMLIGCAQTIPKTGDPNIDMALSNDALSYETKMNILRAHRGEPVVLPEYRPSLKSKLAANQRKVITNYRPVVDQAVCADCDYESDLAQCQSITANNTNISGSAVSGAATDAAASALMGAFLGVDPGHMAAMGASVGALRGAGTEMMTINQMIARCMVGRGYSVLR